MKRIICIEIRFDDGREQGQGASREAKQAEGQGRRQGRRRGRHPVGRDEGDCDVLQLHIRRPPTRRVLASAERPDLPYVSRGAQTRVQA
jgi:hypothetical protein